MPILQIIIQFVTRAAVTPNCIPKWLIEGAELQTASGRMDLTEWLIKKLDVKRSSYITVKSIRV